MLETLHRVFAMTPNLHKGMRAIKEKKTKKKKKTGSQR